MVVLETSATHIWLELMGTDRLGGLFTPIADRNIIPGETVSFRVMMFVVRGEVSDM